MIDTVKLKFYYEFVLGQVYAEGNSPFHRTITYDVIERFVDPLNLNQQCKILDLGCGPGYFLEAMRDRGYSDVTGITLSPEDIESCRSRDLQVEQRDMNFLRETDESVDMLFCRHSLEHSPFPYITLLEYNRVLRPRGILYIEVPRPDCERPHESNANHYSILGRTMWLNLMKRSGFDVDWYEYDFPVKTSDGQTFQEQYYIFVCRRIRPVDVK